MRHRLVVVSLLILTLAVGVLPGTASAVQPGQRLSADEARATFSVTNPQFPCFTHDVWLSALVGDVMPLGPGAMPGDTSQVYASDSVNDSCTGQSQLFDGSVTLEPDQVDFVRLDSFAIHNVLLTVTSESGYVFWFTLDLTWTPTSKAMNGGYGLEPGPGLFQVERFVLADVTGTVLVTDDWYFPGQPWAGEIAHLTQIGPPRP
jgi:hypothetical protein